MIRAIAVQLNDYLAALGAPFTCEYGATGGETCWRDGFISLERDRTGDSFAPVQAVHRNPKLATTRLIALRFRIWAQTSRRGAAIWEHERRAERVLDYVLSGMAEIASVRGNAWVPRAGQFVTPEDLGLSENEGGAVYELTGTFDRGVARVGIMGPGGEIISRPTVWADGADRDEGTITQVAPADGEMKIRGNPTAESW